MRLSSHWSIEQRIIGGDTTVLVVDNFYEDPADVRESALSRGFDVRRHAYPGMHADLDGEEPGMMATLAGLCALLRSQLNFAASPKDIASTFSIITTPVEDLAHAQLQPHVDSAACMALVFLSKEDLGGTGFFRNRLLGLHRIDSSRDQRRWQGFAGDPVYIDRAATGYMSGSTLYWELLDSVEGRFNRLLVFPGRLFHTALVRAVPMTSDPASARLTQRFNVFKGRTCRPCGRHPLEHQQRLLRAAGQQRCR